MFFQLFLSFLKFSMSNFEECFTVTQVLCTVINLNSPKLFNNQMRFKVCRQLWQRDILPIKLALMCIAFFGLLPPRVKVVYLLVFTDMDVNVYVTGVLLVCSASVVIGKEGESFIIYGSALRIETRRFSFKENNVWKLRTQRYRSVFLVLAFGTALQFQDLGPLPFFR